MSHTRREFLQGSASCAGYLVGSLALAHAGVRHAFAANPSGRVVAEEAFARIEEIADGVWAVISTPLKDGGRHFTTTSNGGIIVGKDGVLVIEGYYTNEGGAWLATQVRELTGREPTHVVVTHYHADHVRGLAGIGSERAPSADPLRMMTTPTTRALLEDNEEKILPDALIDEDDRSTKLDLGGRSVEIVARKGHTASDVTLHLAEPRVVWCGDLVWNGMFPNYVDAIPSHLTRNCEAILDNKRTTYVPGHGDATDAKGMASYIGLLQDVERGARAAIEKGVPAADAAAEYSLPDTLSDWAMFSPTYFEVAFRAWERELAPERQSS